MRGRRRGGAAVPTGTALAAALAVAAAAAQEPSVGSGSDPQATSSLGAAESLLARGDTVAAESLAASVHRAARGRDVQAYVDADRFLLEIARARSVTNPRLAAERYERLTGRAEAESLHAVDMERRGDELSRMELMLRATDVDSLMRQLDSLRSAPARDGGPPGPAVPDPTSAGGEADGGPGSGAGLPRALLLGGAAALVAGAVALGRLIPLRRAGLRRRRSR